MRLQANANGLFNVCCSRNQQGRVLTPGQGGKRISGKTEGKVEMFHSSWVLAVYKKHSDGVLDTQTKAFKENYLMGSGLRCVISYLGQYQLAARQSMDFIPRLDDRAAVGRLYCVVVYDRKRTG